VCAGCKNPIEGSYYQYGGRAICESCSAQVRRAAMMPQATPSLGRPLLFGAGAALACSVVYAIVTILLRGTEIGNIAVVATGYLVGRAVRSGANGAGARSLQILAVVLTYLFMPMIYIFLLLYRFSNAPAQLMQLLPRITGLALAAPLMNLRDGASGILGIIIVGVGLLQAWRMTAPRRIMPLAGPFPAQGPTVV
jgi:hypothetical protein